MELQHEVGLEKLALQVIKRAIKDAVSDTGLERDKKDAIKFLTVYNSDLEFWCLCANLDPKSVFRETSKLKLSSGYWKQILKKLDRIEKTMLMLQDRIKLVQNEIDTIDFKRFKTEVDKIKLIKLENELKALIGQINLYA